nr:MAG TPA: hypothetical protein [Caudoviricetes sp.]
MEDKVLSRYSTLFFPQYCGCKYIISMKHVDKF